MPTNLCKLLLPALLASVLFWSCRKQPEIVVPTPAVSTVSDIRYGAAINFNGAEQKLHLDWYHTGATTPQPLIVLLHNGDFRSGSKVALSGLCRALAQKRFTVLSLEYRQGMPPGACSGNAYTLAQALYRAAQDVHTALRFVGVNADSLRIDTSKVFVGGAGAGAMAALSAAFVGPGEFKAGFPEIEQDLGPLYGNNRRKPCAIKGVINMGGGLLSSLATTQASLPVIGFYNQEDTLIPGFTGNYGRCANYPRVFGPQYIYRQMAAKQAPAMLHERGRGATWVYDDEYIADNVSCFIKAVLEGRRPTGVFANTTSICY